MKMGPKPILFVLTLSLFTGCGEEDKDKKKKDNPNRNTGSGEQMPDWTPCASTTPTTPPTQSASNQGAGGMGDMFGQILKNPDLIKDVMKIFGGLLGKDGDNPLKDLLGALQGGNLDQIKALLQGNPELATQVAGILDGLNLGTGANGGGVTLQLQQGCVPASSAPNDSAPPQGYN